VTQAPRKIELRKGATTSDSVTLEVWVDPDAAFQTFGFDLDLRKSPGFGIDTENTDPASGILSSLILDGLIRESWSPQIGSETSGVYAFGGFSLAASPDPNGLQKLLSVEVAREAGAGTALLPELSNIQFTLADNTTLTIPKTYSYAFPI
jgi:hypothetical protein